jgi:ferredoxin
MSKTYTVTHYRKKCISCGACALEAPQSWSMSEEDGYSCLEGALDKGQFWVGKIIEEDLEDNKRAAKNCPVKIIKVIE